MRGPTIGVSATNASIGTSEQIELNEKVVHPIGAGGHAQDLG